MPGKTKSVRKSLGRRERQLIKLSSINKSIKALLYCGRTKVICSSALFFKFYNDLKKKGTSCIKNIIRKILYMYMKFFNQTIFIIILFSTNLFFAMEHNPPHNHFRDLAEEISKNYKGPTYFTLYSTMLQQLTHLSPENQLNALTHMISVVVEKNRPLSKKFCSLVRDRYESTIEGTSYEHDAQHYIRDKS